MSAQVSRITVAAGDLTVAIEPSDQWGDNPRFYAAQVEDQLEKASVKLRAILEARFGEQVSLEQARADKVIF